MLTSPSYVNAPGPGDPVYLDDKGLGVGVNLAMGYACGFGLKILNKFRIGDDIIELGISKGPIYSQQVSTRVINPCVVCSKGNADVLGLTDDIVAKASYFENPNFIKNFPEAVKSIPDGNFQPVPGHFATKYGDRIIDSALEANLKLRGHNITLDKVHFTFEEYANYVDLLR
jgi:hypothetical protein